MKEKIKIIAEDKIPFLQGVFNSNVKIQFLPYSELTNEKIRDADALIVRTRVKCNAELLDNTNIKFIASPTIGIDHIDTVYCKENDITWVNAPGCNSSSVNQYVASALLTLAEKHEFNLKDKTIGIIGVGNVGGKVQRTAEILGMNVLLNDPPRERTEGKKNFCDIEKLISESDIISLHVPLIKDGRDKTYHFFNKELFNNFSNPKVLINTSRGEVINTLELKEAIKNKKVCNSVIDVWENEPNIDLELLEMSEFTTPHIAGYSTDGKANGTAICVNKINKYFNLGLKENWQPLKLPSTLKGNEIKIDCKNKSEQKIIWQVVNKTYSISKDSERLKTAPTFFESQRDNYRIRREFGYFNVTLVNSNSKIENKLNALGFNLS